MRLEPVRDHVIVRPLVESMTASGIVLPESAQDRERSKRGEIVAVGPGRIDTWGRFVPMDLSVGQEVVFTKWNGHEVRGDDGEELVLVERPEILALVIEDT